MENLYALLFVVIMTACTLVGVGLGVLVRGFRRKVLVFLTPFALFFASNWILVQLPVARQQRLLNRQSALLGTWCVTSAKSPVHVYEFAANGAVYEQLSGAKRAKIGDFQMMAPDKIGIGWKGRLPDQAYRLVHVENRIVLAGWGPEREVLTLSPFGIESAAYSSSELGPTTRR
jgi:hypothetical protein